MKNAMIVALAALAALLLIASAQAADVGFDVNVSVGNQPRQREVVYLPAPAPQPVYIEEAPEFIYPAELGFYVAVGVPYDLFRISNRYYLFRDGGWYRAPYYNGPWARVSYRSLPPGLRRHKHERIVYIRDEEYRHYRDDRERYHGKHFRPEKEWKERRNEEKEYRKDERKYEKEMRKSDREERKHSRHEHDD